MGTIKDRNGMDLTEAEDKKRWQEYTELYKKDLHDPDNHDGVITHLEPDILECKVKWALGKWNESHSVMSNSLRPHGLCSPQNFPGQNTGVGSLSLLQGIFPSQGSNPGLLHCRQTLYKLSHRGSPLALGSITTNKASGGDGIPVVLFQILKDDAVEVLHSIANLENSAVATGLEKISFHSIPKKGNAKECSSYCTIVCSFHMLAR